jgi:hypothetical protein
MTVDSCAKYDEVSIDPASPNGPIEKLLSMVHRVQNKKRVPPYEVA